MSKLLITGGCGFIGSNLIRHFLRGDNAVWVTNLDALTYAGNLANLADLESHPRYRFVHGDVADRAAMRSLFDDAGFDAVIHLAAESHVDRSIHDATPFVRTNVLGTQVLLDTAREFKVGRFIQVSTDEVYGSLGPTGLFTEETPLAANSPYSASKAAADLLVRSYCHTYGFPGIVTRCSNNYGPYQFPEKLIPLFISNLMNHQPVPVYGDGLNVRDWLHVSDHCTALEAVWRGGRSGEVYNIGGNSELTNLDLTQQILAALKKPGSLMRFVADRPGHDRRYAIDSAKIRRELGWVPQVSFATGLVQTIEWYQAHQDWVESIKTGAYREYFRKQYGVLA